MHAHDIWHQIQSHNQVQMSKIQIQTSLLFPNVMFCLANVTIELVLFDILSEDIPCSGDITMIMDSLREFVIDTDPLRDLFSQPVA